MYVGPQVGSLVDLQREPRRCQGHRVAVPLLRQQETPQRSWGVLRIVVLPGSIR